ncbi:MAG TPA: glycosyl hydrolase family 28-related protein [Longimicrobium sp.]|nr:glycosyl hydrolase family 28-related protein [Longimicrobium sp.]
MPTYTDPVVAPSFTGVVRDKGGEVFDVKAYGAVGDNTTDDTAAVQAAVSAANAVHSSLTESLAVDSGKGAVVYFPPGIYRITSEIHVSSAVTIRGAGMYTTQLRMDTSEATTSATTTLHDGLVWDIGPEATDAHHVGSGIEDIDVITQATPWVGARDLLVLKRQHNFHITNVRVHGARENGVRMEECVHVTALNLFTHSCGTSGVLVETKRNSQGVVLSYNTTINFQSCYFENTLNGPGADVSGYGITFDGCVFEATGYDNEVNAASVLGRWGTFSLTNPYFERNYGWDMLFGTEEPEGFHITTVTVVNPVLSYLAKAANTGAFRAARGIITLLGGDYTDTTAYNQVALGADVKQVYLFANAPNVVSEAAGGNLANVPGLLVKRNSTTARGVLTGAYDIQTGAVTATGTVAAAQLTIGGGATITKHLSATATWTPGLVANGGFAELVVDVPGASFGDTVVVSFNHTSGGGGLGSGVLLFGSVAGASGGVVAVTLLNMKGSALTLGSGTVRVDVWKH